MRVAKLLFFFFQAEDGIRDHCVTGVQTCALPISAPAPLALANAIRRRALQRCIAGRSEEHTSELQSHSDLVCRLLLAKKKSTCLCPRETTAAPSRARGPPGQAAG